VSPRIWLLKCSQPCVEYRYPVRNKKRSRRRPVFRRLRSGVSPTVRLRKLDARSDATPLRSSRPPTTFLILNRVHILVNTDNSPLLKYFCEFIRAVPDIKTEKKNRFVLTKIIAYNDDGTPHTPIVYTRVENYTVVRTGI